MNPKYIILLIIIVFLFLKLKGKNTRLKNTISEKNSTIEALTQKIQEQEQQKSSYKEYKENENEFQYHLEMFPEQYYGLKDSCMNKNESRIFFYLNCALDEFFPKPDERENYLIFPQMSLHAFIRILPEIKENYMLEKIASRTMVAKNVDFIICRRFKENEYYLYQPLILIEIDGSSHYSPKYGEKILQRQQNSDAFKDKLFTSLSIPLIRYQMERDRITRTDRYKIKQELSHYFQKQTT